VLWSAMSPRIAFIPYTAPKIDAEETTCASAV
jgi:hypothetical protein